jgi:hypothetical protein
VVGIGIGFLTFKSSPLALPQKTPKESRITESAEHYPNAFSMVSADAGKTETTAIKETNKCGKNNLSRLDNVSSMLILADPSVCPIMRALFPWRATFLNLRSVGPAKVVEKFCKYIPLLAEQDLCEFVANRSTT